MERSERRMDMLRKLAAEVDKKPKPSPSGKPASSSAQKPAAKPAAKPAGDSQNGSAGQQQDQGQELVSGLMQAYEAETFAAMAFTTFASCATGVHRAYMAAFWIKEAHEELDHAKAIGEKICAMGGMPASTSRPMPDARTAQAMIQAALQIEQQAVQLYSTLSESAGASGQHGIRAFLEEILVDEQKHMDDLSLMAQDFEHQDPNNVIGQQVQQNFQSMMGTAGPIRMAFPPQSQQGGKPPSGPQAPPPV